MVVPEKLLLAFSGSDPISFGGVRSLAPPVSGVICAHFVKTSRMARQIMWTIFFRI